MSEDFAASYSSTRSSSSGSSYSSTRTSSPSSSGYSSTRTSSPSTSKSYSSTRTSTPSTSSSYTSTRTSTPSTSSRYTATRTIPVTRSNINQVTSSSQRTTVVNNYYHDHMWYNSMFHPFGWGYGGGNFWMWMYLFDRPQYNTNQQIVQAQSQNGQVAVVQDNSWIGTGFMLVLLIGFIAMGWWIVRMIRRHMLWVR